MKFSIYLALIVPFTVCSTGLSQLPEQLNLDFEQSDDFNPEAWLFVAPTPLGVTQADPHQVLSVADGNWNWSMQAANEVLVSIYQEVALVDSAVETTFDFVGEGGISIGFLNRFGDVDNLAHGYCTLVSPKTITLIDFDFARPQDDYIRAIHQTPTPEGLFTGEQTTVRFQTMDKPSTADPNVLLPTFDFWLGDSHIFTDVQDPNATWAAGFAGVDVWTVDPFAQETTDNFTVHFDSLAIRGVPVPEPNSMVLAAMSLLAVAVYRQRRR